MVDISERSKHQQAIREIEKKYLLENGWEMNTDNPISVWMWEKEIDGKTYHVDRKMAVKFQSKLDAWESANEQQ